MATTSSLKQESVSFQKQNVSHSLICSKANTHPKTTQTFHWNRDGAYHLQQQQEQNMPDFFEQLLRNEEPRMVAEACHSLMENINNLHKADDSSTNKKELVLPSQFVQTAIDTLDIDVMHMYFLGCLKSYSAFKQYCIENSGPQIIPLIHWLNEHYDRYLTNTKLDKTHGKVEYVHESYLEFVWQARSLYFSHMGCQPTTKLSLS
jgi:hypothetical protein